MKRLDSTGFTLIELMISLLLSSLVLIAIGVFFRAQQENYTNQEEVAEMQQEVRSGVEIMSRELRNAGHDATVGYALNAGFRLASAAEVRFTMDIGDAAGGIVPNGALDPNEDVRYRLVNDAGGDGVDDAGAGDLGREVGGVGGLQPMVSNVHALGFAYAVDADGDGNIDLNPLSGEIDWSVPSGGGWVGLDSNNDGVIDNNDVTPPPATFIFPADEARLDQIRAVRIWLLSRASRVDPQFTDSNTYKVGAVNIAAPNDNFRRRLLVTSIRCRNMGLIGGP